MPTRGASTPSRAVVLSAGSEGRQVELLQRALGAIKADGVFGPETEAAVRSFQAKAGLTVDGVVGSLTGATLRGQVAGEEPWQADLDARLEALDQLAKLAAVGDKQGVPRDHVRGVLGDDLVLTQCVDH